MDVVLRSEKVILRPIEEDDTDNIVKWRNNKEVSEKFIYREAFTRESQILWMNGKVKTGEVVQFIIHSVEDDIDIGSIYIRDIDMSKKEAEYGIFIGEDVSRGKGLGVESIRLMIKYAFDGLQLDRIILRVYKDNIPSIKSNEKAGFKIVSEIRDVVSSDGKKADMYIMEATKSVHNDAGTQ